MADNSQPIAGGDIYATDDISGIKYQRVKVTYGDDGSATDASANNPLPVIEKKDYGRTRLAIIFQGTAPATADTLLTLVRVADGVAGAGTTTVAITAGKKLRITGIVLGVKAGAATAAYATLNLRVNPSGAAVIGSQSELRLDCGVTGAAIGSAISTTLPLGDGIEFTGAQQIGVSLSAQATTNVISVTLLGYEY